MNRVTKKPFPTDPHIVDASIIGHAVRACRTEAGHTLVETAMSIGVAKQTLSDLENGRPTVKFGTALKISHALGVNLFVVNAKDREFLKRTIQALAK